MLVGMTTDMWGLSACTVLFSISLASVTEREKNLICFSKVITNSKINLMFKT